MDYSFKQGEDKKITLEVKEDGIEVDLTQSTNIKCALFVNGEQQKIFALTPSAGEGMLEKDGVDNWKVNFFVERVDSQNFPIGPMTAILIVSFPDVQFPDGNRVSEYSFSIGSIWEGKGRNVSL